MSKLRPILVLAAATAGLALPVSSAADPSLNQLSNDLSATQAHAQSLSASISNLNTLIATLSSQIAFVQQREADVRAQLAHDREVLAQTTTALDRERRLLAILIARLEENRALLARQLVSGYESDNPDLVTIILEAHGFQDLLDKIQYLKSAEGEQNSIIAVTRAARAQADTAAKRLAVLEATDRQITASTAIRAQALAGMNALLSSRQAALAQARAAQAAALAAAQQHGQALQAQIAKIQAQQAAAQQAASSSPSLPTPFGSSVASGGWVIPSAVVACESGGQNLTPNSAGASGYYQIIPSTWQQFGGTGPAAYLAPKSAQDQVAARIWAGGAGAGNWVCAQMLGIH